MKKLVRGWLYSAFLAVVSTGMAYPLQVEGDTAGWRLGVWLVSAYGEPLREVSAVNLAKNTTLPLLPDPTETIAVGPALAWPGLVDFASASAPARVSETKFFLYQDKNNNAKRDANEPLQEVKLSAADKKGRLFLVWASEDVTIKAGRGYEAKLNKGWNPLLVDIKSQVSVSAWPKDLPFLLKRSSP